MTRKSLLTAAALAASLAARPAGGAPSPSVARLWNEALLSAIRTDIPKPPAHARNLYHLSVAMWDAWAAYAPEAHGVLVKEKRRARDVEGRRAEAISYAAYRLLTYRFPEGHLDADGKPCHPGAAASRAQFDALMDALGYDRTFTGTEGDSPAALGNRIAAAVIAFGRADGANEGDGLCYADDTGYAPVNAPLIVALPGAGDVTDVNRWQPLAFDYAVTQNGIPLGKGVQRFVGVGWGRVTPFALTAKDVDPGTGLYLDPGPPPQLGGAGDDVLKAAMLELIRFNGGIDAEDESVIDTSPAAMFGNSLGHDDGSGHARNPDTGEAYAPNLVRRADYQRVVAEYWSDGPRSETPPGHWNVLANAAADASFRHGKRIGGAGRPVNDLEWDVKVYLALNGAVHDAAIWAWGNKTHYDSSRPITLIRAMAAFGQSSDPALPSYDARGLPLVPGVVELVTAESAAPGGRHENLAGHEGEIAVRCWRGGPDSPRTDVSGVGWKLGVEWLPYMPKNFVTPPFPGYTSGHSAFSRAGAEVLAAITGSPFFPGGLATFEADADAFLKVERGPSRTVTLQWATYFDAADQAAISRRYGGIHPFYDDYPSRVGGSAIGKKAWARALELFGGATP